MRIVLIHQYYLHQGQGGSARFNDMVATWCAAGHQVQVIAGQVDYATGQKPGRWRGRLWSREEAGGVNIWRVYTPGTYQRSVWGRGVSWGGFGVAAALALTALIGRADLCLVTSPPLTVSLCAAVAKLWGVPLIVEVRDLWPASAVAVGSIEAGGAVYRVLEGMERRMVGWADQVVALTPGIARDMVGRGLAEGVKVIPNGADVLGLEAGVMGGRSAKIGERRRGGGRGRLWRCMRGRMGGRMGWGRCLRWPERSSGRGGMRRW